MAVDELPIVFPCQTEQLIGIIHKPESTSAIGVLIVVGNIELVVIGNLFY